jgi:hypothetical protein
MARKTGKNLSSNEEVSPDGDHIPRLPGTKRDFGGLPLELRSEKGSRSNLVRAEGEGPPQGTHPSRESKSHTLLGPEPTVPLHRAIAKRLRYGKKA